MATEEQGFYIPFTDEETPESQAIDYLRDKEENGSDLEKEVAVDILEKENVLDYMKDVLRYGCQSGTVGSLIYYNQTHAFFLRHYEAIFDMLENIKEETGEEFSNYNGDRPNTLAWLAYEETVRKFCDELEVQW